MSTRSAAKYRVPQHVDITSTLPVKQGGPHGLEKAGPTGGGLGAALLQAIAVGGKPHEPLCFTAYPNVGALYGEVEVQLPATAEMKHVRQAVARSVLGDVDPSCVRLFAADGSGMSVASISDLKHQAARSGLVASSGFPLRPCAEGFDLAHAGPASSSQQRYDPGLAGGQVSRFDASDPELPSLLQCPVPVVVEHSGLLGKAPETWSFDYLDRGLSDVDNFFVLCSPAKSRGRFAYYDLGAKKNPCGYEVTPTNERVEMRFPDFRRKVAEARKRRQAGKKTSSFYLQNALLHRDDSEEGPPRPVGSFGVTCGRTVANDIGEFRWDWLRASMGGRHPQMCQFFCGMEGDFSPCHYDPQDNLFTQVRGFKRVLLFHPKHFGCLYPWPVHHPQDRQSRVDFGAPDLSAFPRFAELRGCGLEAVLGPGDALRIPPGWWHHIEMLPSPEGEVVSINFWYTPPTWFRGSVEAGEISWDRPLFGVRRVLFQRCVEELAGQSSSPADVREVVEACAGLRPLPTPSSCLHAAVQTVQQFVSTVFPDVKERHSFFAEIIAGRFFGLVPCGCAQAGP